MGSCGSRSQTNSVSEIDKIQHIDNHPLVTAETSLRIRIKAMDEIKKDDVHLVKNLMGIIRPMESLRMQGENYTCLHYAAEQNSFQAMEIMLRYLFAEYQEKFFNICNIQDIDKETPAMKAAKVNALDTLYVMIAFKTVDMRLKNKQHKTIKDICSKFSKKGIQLLKLTQNPDSLPQKNLEKQKSNPKMNGNSNHHLNDETIDVNKNIAENNEEKQNGHTNQSLEKKFELEDIGPRLNIDNNEVRRIVRKLVQVLIERDKEKVSKEIRVPVTEFEKRIQENLQKSKLVTVLNKLQGGNMMYEDPDFITNISSITDKKNHSQYAIFEKAHWLRAHEIIGCAPEEVKLIDNVDPHDIIQGILGVCYFLAAQSCIAEFPDRLKKIFVNERANKYGIYSLKYYLKGIPTEVTIDDKFPCYEGQNKPIFARPQGNEIWVLLLEKSWAKVYGNYTFCEYGKSSEAFENLLGCASASFPIEEKDPELFWKRIRRAEFNKHFVCVSSKEQPDDEEETAGILSQHSYSMLGTYELGKYRVIKLRNPWGKFEWKGDFSDDSPLWTERWKRIVGYRKADDGMFCMKLEDFVERFNEVHIGYYNEGWDYTYIEITENTIHSQYFEFSLEHETEVYFRLHQKDKRFLPEEDRKGFKYSPGFIWIAKVNEDGSYEPTIVNNSELDQSNFHGGRSVYPSTIKKVCLAPGKYVARTKIRWRDGQQAAYTFSSYAENEIHFAKVKEPTDFKKRYYAGLAKHSGEAKIQNVDKNLKCVYGEYGPFVYFTIKNENLAQIPIVSLTFDKMENVKMGKTGEGNSFKSKEIPKGDSALFLLKKVDIEKDSQYSWKYNVSTLK